MKKGDMVEFMVSTPVCPLTKCHGKIISVEKNNLLNIEVDDIDGDKVKMFVFYVDHKKILKK